MAEPLSFITLAIGAAKLGVTFIDTANSVYRFNQNVQILDERLQNYKTSLRDRERRLRECNRTDDDQLRGAHTDANRLLKEARAALGHVQGLRERSRSASGWSRLLSKITMPHELQEQLKRRTEEFEKALYDLDIELVHLRLIDGRLAAIIPGRAESGESASEIASTNDSASTPATDPPPVPSQLHPIPPRFIYQGNLHSQGNIVSAVISTSGRFIGLFAATKFWIYDIGVYFSPFENNLGFEYPSHPALTTTGTFDNSGYNYYYGPRNTRHTYEQKIKIRLAALSDDFLAIVSEKTVFIFGRLGRCFHSITLHDEDIRKVLFSPSGSELVIISTYAAGHHRAIYIPIQDIPTSGPEHIRTLPIERQPIKQISEWASTYMPRHAIFSDDGNTLVIGTARHQNAKCEIRIFQYSRQRTKWQSIGDQIIGLFDEVSQSAVRLTGIQFFSPVGPQRMHYLLLSLYSPGHSDNPTHKIEDWRLITHNLDGKLELKDARRLEDPECQFPSHWPTNRFNNIAIAVASAYNAVVVYDDQGHLSFRQFFIEQENGSEYSFQSVIRPQDRHGAWDVSVSFTEDSKRLVILKRNGALEIWGLSDSLE